MASIDDLFEPSKSFSDAQMELLISSSDSRPALPADDTLIEAGVEPGPSGAQASEAQKNGSFIWDEFASGVGPVSARSGSGVSPTEASAPRGPAELEDLRGAGLRGQYTWLWVLSSLVLMSAAAGLAWWVTLPEPAPEPEPPPPEVITAAPVGPASEESEGRLGAFEPTKPRAEIELGEVASFTPMHQTKPCIRRREDAKWARSRGDWTALAELAKKEECWRRRYVAREMRLNASFELGDKPGCRRLARHAKRELLRAWGRRCGLKYE